MCVCLCQCDYLIRSHGVYTTSCCRVCQQNTGASNATKKKTLRQFIMHIQQVCVFVCFTCICICVFDCKRVIEIWDLFAFFFFNLINCTISQAFLKKKHICECSFVDICVCVCVKLNDIRHKIALHNKSVIKSFWKSKLGVHPAWIFYN